MVSSVYWTQGIKHSHENVQCNVKSSNLNQSLRNPFFSCVYPNPIRGTFKISFLLLHVDNIIKNQKMIGKDANNKIFTF